MATRRWMGVFLLVVATYLGAGCSGADNANGGGGGATPTPTPLPTPTPVVPPGSIETVYIGGTGMNAPGDTAKVFFDDSGKSRIPLRHPTLASPGRDNTQEEFTLILYNSSDSQTLGFSVTSPDDTNPPAAPKLLAKTAQETPLHNNMEQEFMDLVQKGHPKASPQANPFNPLILASVGDAVGARRVFNARCDVDNNKVFCPATATLRQQTTNANVWVDDDIPFGTSDPNAMTQAQIDRLANLYQNNIYPLLTKLLRTPSDVNGDGRVSILITPLMNRLPWTDGDKLDAPSPIYGYVDPRDLLAYNAFSNAGSNEDEVIYVRALDPIGFWGPSTGTDYDIETAATVAAGLEKLISYNQHVFVNHGNPEESWFSDGLGAVAAMLCGLGEVFYEDVHHFLDVPHAFALKASSDYLLQFPAARYLFVLHLLYSQLDGTVQDSNSDGYDDQLAFLANFYRADTGIQNIENVITFPFVAGRETEFDALFKAWTVALVTSHNSLQQAGSTFNYYRSPNALVFGTAINDASGSTRDDGSGARLSTQIGINFYGRNGDPAKGIPYYLFENADELTYTPGHIAYGSVKPYTAYYVRLGGLIEPSTNLLISASTAMQGFLVRRQNITYRRIWGEKVFGSLETRREKIYDPADLAHSIFPTFPTTYDVTKAGSNPLDLPGDEITIVGRIDPSDTLAVYDQKGLSYTYQEVPDFDRYEITVPNVGGNPNHENLAIWVEKQADGVDGASTLKPLLAIVSKVNLLDPFVTGPRPRYRWIWQDPNAPNPELEPFVEPTATVTCTNHTPAGDYRSPAYYSSSLRNLTGYPNYTYDVLFNLEIPNTDPSYPAYDPASKVYYEPRHVSAVTQNCFDAGTPPALDAPDNELAYIELKKPTTLTQQFMTYMMREYSTAVSDPTCFAIDSEVRDEETDSGLNKTAQWVDFYHNVGGHTVPPYTTDSGVLYPKGIHVTDLPKTDPGILSINCGGDTNWLRLTPGNTYVILVAGARKTVGQYALKMRWINDPDLAHVEQEKICDQ